MILHVDMDAFYASVEERNRPELQGKPLIVGGAKESRGVVAAANYEARKYGIHSAMPAREAFRRCPELISIPPRIDLYAQVSRKIREIFFHYTPLVEPLSLDEAFLDVTGCRNLFGSGPEIAQKIKTEIFSETQLVASVGVAPNKFLAKIASDLEKPDALVIVDGERIQEFLDPLPVGRIWGVGKVTGTQFERMGIRTIRNLRELDLRVLQSQFGSQGEHFYKLARGIDTRKVVPDREAKSISHERTFEIDIFDQESINAWAMELTEQVARRLRRHKLLARTVHLKVRFANFKTITRSYTLENVTNVTAILWSHVSRMIAAAIPERHNGVRLIGVGTSHFEQPGKVQKSLFADEDSSKQKRLDSVADQIQDKFGLNSLARGIGMLHDITKTKAHETREDV